MQTVFACISVDYCKAACIVAILVSNRPAFWPSAVVFYSFLARIVNKKMI